jgi:hypothetical protein
MQEPVPVKQMEPGVVASAAPVKRDLLAESTKFIPLAVRKKMQLKAAQAPPPPPPAPISVPQPKPSLAMLIHAAPDSDSE